MISGRYLDGMTAASVEATLEFGSANVTVLGPPHPVSASLERVRVSDRIANITRRVMLPNGGVFETEDNDAVDRACEAAGIKLRSGLVHWLESRWPVAVGSMFAVALIAVGFMRWGLPAITNWAAAAIPAETDQAIGQGTLDVLDDAVFYPSRLSSERQGELQRKFTDMTVRLDDGHDYQLVLRNGARIGPNAFALPSGIIVMTDQLVNLAENDEEIIAVLAHEIGHVRGRHALRQMLKAAGVSAMAMALYGDIGNVTGVLGAWPVLLNAKHSREFETEADEFAKQWLKEHDIAGSRFDTILCRLFADSGEGSSLNFLASHPPTNERADCARGN